MIDPEIPGDMDWDKLTEIHETVSDNCVDGVWVNSGWVYFALARGNGAIKVGYTKGDAAKRLSSLQTGCPDELELLGVCPGSKRLEGLIHQFLWPCSVRGEWFTDCEYVRGVMFAVGCKSPIRWAQIMRSAEGAMA